MAAALELVLPEDFDDLYELEMQMRGFLDGSVAVSSDKSFYPINFYRPYRVYAELNAQVNGEAAPCWIQSYPVALLPEITRERLQKSVAYLDSIQYFDSLAPASCKAQIEDRLTTSSNEPVEIVCPSWMDDDDIAELPIEGVLRASITLGNNRYPVSFFHPTRLKQELDIALAKGFPCFAEPGLVVVKEIEVDILYAAVRYLAAYGFFEHLKVLGN